VVNREFATIRSSLAKRQALAHLFRMAEDLEFPESGKIDNKLLFSTLQDIRRDQREIKELVVDLTKHVPEVDKRLAKRIGDLADRLEIMLNSKLLGRLTNFETRVDQKIDELLAP